MKPTKLAAAIRLMLALLEQVEWEDDLDQTACPTGFVSCRWCAGGSSSGRRKPKHHDACPYVTAINAAKEALQ